MDRLITLLALLLAAGIAGGGGGVWAWDRHAPISIPLLFWHLKLPDSLASQRDAAVADQGRAVAAQKRCDDAMTAQNASLAQAASLGAAAMAQAQSQLDAVKVQNVRLRAGAQQLAAFRPSVGETQCQRWDRADGAVLAALMEGN